MNTVNHGKFTGCMPNKVRGGGYRTRGWGRLICTLHRIFVLGRIHLTSIRWCWLRSRTRGLGLVWVHHWLPRRGGCDGGWLSSRLGVRITVLLCVLVVWWRLSWVLTVPGRGSFIPGLDTSGIDRCTGYLNSIRLMNPGSCL